MSTSAAPLGTLGEALSRLIDYAGLFPPARLEMPAAVDEYAAARSGPYAWILERFIVPASRLAELRAAFPAGEAPFGLSVILDQGWSAEQLAQLRACDGDLRIEALEVPADPERIEDVAAALTRAGFGELPIYVEWPRGEDWIEGLDAAMERLARSGLRAKIRCGGLVQEAFPSTGELAAFVVCAARRRIAFKATAGLHHPIRHFNAPSGLTMHGFLNLLFATVFATQGAAAGELDAILACEDPQAFHVSGDGLRFRGRTADAQSIRAARDNGFAAYGSCSFSEPVEDLLALGVL